MAGFFDGLVKGLASLAPQDDPEVKIFNAQNELKALDEKENAIFAQLGRQVYEAGGKEAYPEAGVQLDALAASRAQVQQKVTQLKEEKAAKERAEAQAAAERAAAEAARTCPNCGTVNGEGCKFCCDCGTRLPEPAPAEPKKRFCTACGSEVVEGMRFCSACGTRQE